MWESETFNDRPKPPTKMYQNSPFSPHRVASANWTFFQRKKGFVPHLFSFKKKFLRKCPAWRRVRKLFFKGEKGGTNPVFLNSFLEFSMFCKEKQRKQRKTKKSKESKENKEKQRKAKKNKEKQRKIMKREKISIKTKF